MARGVRVVLLLGALILLGIATFRPHWDDAAKEPYPYPLHLDEYFHWGYAEAIAEQGTIPFSSPFDPRPSGAFDLGSDVHERGFQTYVAVLSQASGIPVLALFALGPVVVALVLGLAVYALAERWGAGVEAVLFLIAIPTTLRFLGPGFFVPIAFALPVLVMALFSLFALSGPGGVALLAVFSTSLWTIHAKPAGAFTFVALVYAMVIARENSLRAASVAVATALPALAGLPHLTSAVDAGVLRPGFLDSDPQILLVFGLVPLLAAAAGAWLLATARDAGERREGIVLGVALVVGEAILLIRNATGKDPAGLYDRMTTLVFLFAAVLAGVAFARAYARGARALGAPGRARIAATIVLVALVAAQGGALAASVAKQEERPVFHVLDSREHAAFEEAAKLNLSGHRALVDGLSSMAWATMTGVPAVNPQFPGDPAPSPVTVSFFESGAKDTFYILETGATLVVTMRPVDNPDLHPIADGVYALRPDLVERLNLRQVPG